MRAQALSVRRRPAPGMGVWRVVVWSARSLRASLLRRSRERRRRALEDAWLRFEDWGPRAADPRDRMEFWRFRPPPG